jgi:hypothetical protein
MEVFVVAFGGDNVPDHAIAAAPECSIAASGAESPPSGTL